jgi:8-amino-7-oxononanoate synthase
VTDAPSRSKGPLGHLAQELAELERAGLLRVRPEAVDASAGSNAIHLCSNDYLGYRSTGRLVRYARAAAAEHPAGSGASRLVLGEHRAHRALEQAIAKWLGFDETLVFTTGYTANLGLISSLAGEGDLIVSDAWNHASIIDGCRLSRARVVIVPHGAVDEVRVALRASPARRRWVVTEGYFSMEGDSPDLPALRAICDEEDAALLVDDAHAIGALGVEGRGLASSSRPDALVGTLGKALGAQGAFVAGSRDLCRWLWNRARPFVFSTGLSPLLAAIGIGAVAEARADEVGRRRLADVTARLRSGLQNQGLPVVPSHGPIIPIILGAEGRAVAWSRRLAEMGVRIQAIRPPTVPPGTSRLRIATRADLADEDVDLAVEALAQLWRDVGLALR